MFDMIAVNEPPTAWSFDMGDNIAPDEGETTTKTFALANFIEFEAADPPITEIFFRIEEQ